MPIFPLEIFMVLIKENIDEPKQWLEHGSAKAAREAMDLLKVLSLVCKAFLPFTRERLFRHTSIGPSLKDWDQARRTGLLDLINENQQIARQIHYLTYTFDSSATDGAKIDARCPTVDLPNLCALVVKNLSTEPSLYISRQGISLFSECLVSKYVHAGNLRVLHLVNITDVPLLDVLAFPGLEVLSMKGSTFDEHPNVYDEVLATNPTRKYNLKRLEIWKIGIPHRLLRSLPHLQYLRLFMIQMSHTNEPYINFADPSYPSLEVLDFQGRLDLLTILFGFKDGESMHVDILPSLKRFNLAVTRPSTSAHYLWNDEFSAGLAFQFKNLETFSLQYINNKVKRDFYLPSSIVLYLGLQPTLKNLNLSYPKSQRETVEHVTQETFSAYLEDAKAALQFITIAGTNTEPQTQRSKHLENFDTVLHFCDTSGVYRAQNVDMDDIASALIGFVDKARLISPRTVLRCILDLPEHVGVQWAHGVSYNPMLVKDDLLSGGDSIE